MIRASLADLARRRGLPPVLLLPELLREGWTDAEDRQLCGRTGDPLLEYEQLAYDRPDDFELKLEGCESLARLAALVARELPPGPDRQGRLDTAGARDRARFAASVLRESGRLLEGTEGADLKVEELAVGFSILAFAQSRTRDGRASAILWGQLSALLPRIAPACVEPAPGPAWDHAAGRFLLALQAISSAAEAAARGATDQKVRISMEGLSKGWSQDAEKVMARLARGPEPRKP